MGPILMTPTLMARWACMTSNAQHFRDIAACFATFMSGKRMAEQDIICPASSAEKRRSGNQVPSPKQVQWPLLGPPETPLKIV
eukprot:812181-Amphidinium_carterae.1